MRRKIALLLTLVLMLTSFTGVYGADSKVPADVEGTIYETAVSTLMDVEIINGYPDGSFQPAKAVTRAEVAKMVDLAVAEGNRITAAELSSASAAALLKFTDLGTASAWTNWAVDYIGYAVEKGIIDGYPDNTFKPTNSVTYNELAKMLVAALGYTEDQLTGQWPDNYMNKAVELGIMEGFTYMGGHSAIRGNVAIMIYNAFYGEEETETPVDPGNSNDSTGAIDLTKYTVAYGVVNGTSESLNKDENSMKAVDLKLGENELTVPAYDAQGNTAINNLDEDEYLDGTLYAFRLQRKMGEIIAIAGPGSNASWVKHFAELTPAGSVSAGETFATVNSVSSSVFLFEDEDGESTAVPVADEVIVYKLVKKSDGYVYETAKLSSIRKGTKVRLYDVTNDKNDYADIIVIDGR